MSGKEVKLAEIINNYSKDDPGRDWLLDPILGNVFRDSFQQIYQKTGDMDLALWYLAFGQSFGGKTEPMHRKMANLCTSSNQDIISFKRSLPESCPFSEVGNSILSSLEAIDVSEDDEIIRKQIDTIFSDTGSYSFCNSEILDSCPYSKNCPVIGWKQIINENKLRFRSEPKVFFYYDTLVLLNNNKVHSFDDLFLFVASLTPDRHKQTVILVAVLGKIRGIATKMKMFLQHQKLYNNRDLDYLELIFVDKLAIRVAKRIVFPEIENGLISAIETFSRSQNLTPRQIDVALWETGLNCPLEGCSSDGKDQCIFSDLCEFKGQITLKINKTE